MEVCRSVTKQPLSSLWNASCYWNNRQKTMIWIHHHTFLRNQYPAHKCKNKDHYSDLKSSGSFLERVFFDGKTDKVKQIIHTLSCGAWKNLPLQEKVHATACFFLCWFFFTSVAWHKYTEKPFTSFIWYRCDSEQELRYRPGSTCMG